MGYSFTFLKTAALSLVFGTLGFGGCEDTPVEGDAGVVNISQPAVIKPPDPKPPEAYTTCVAECERGNASEWENLRNGCSEKSSRAKTECLKQKSGGARKTEAGCAIEASLVLTRCLDDVSNMRSTCPQECSAKR